MEYYKTKHEEISWSISVSPNEKETDDPAYNN